MCPLRVPYGTVPVPLTVLAIQLSHDVSFGYLVRSIPHGSMTVLDMFRDYARPAILVYDAIIVLSVLAVDWVLRHMTDDTHALVGAICTYLSLMFVHSF